LILCDTKAAADSPEARAARETMAAEVIEQGSVSVAEALIPKLFAAASLHEHAGEVARVGEMIAATDPHTIAGLQRGMARRADATAWLPEIDLPSLLVVGAHDGISPVAEMQQMAASMPQAELVVVPQAGHLAPLENPAYVNHALRRFLAAH